MLIMWTVVLAASAYQLCAMFLAFNTTLIISCIVLFFLYITPLYWGAFAPRCLILYPSQKSKKRLFSKFFPWSLLNILSFDPSLSVCLNISFWKHQRYLTCSWEVDPSVPWIVIHIHNAYFFPQTFSVCVGPKRAMCINSRTCVVMMSPISTCLALVGFPTWQSPHMKWFSFLNAISLV